ncbi:MAG TPA: glycosyltransferase [Phycisphaerales bacterium]|nr:glycosyltransferase [Phycisphaerales bacterium]
MSHMLRKRFTESGLWGRVNRRNKRIFMNTKTTETIGLSIVIPTFQEARKVGGDIAAASEFLTRFPDGGEILIADDGSRDQTADVAEQCAARSPVSVRVLRLERNRGKGCAVRTGILESRGRYVMFADSGCCVPYQEAMTGIELIQSGRCQIAHGSRKMSVSHIHRPQSWYRRLCSRLFHWLLIHDLKRLANLTDTQCGFKVYDGQIARCLYAVSTIDGFMFDVEIILLAMKYGYRICEFPVDWSWDPDSRLKPSHEAIKVLRDLIWLKHQYGDVLSTQRNQSKSAAQ